LITAVFLQSFQDQLEVYVGLTGGRVENSFAVLGIAAFNLEPLALVWNEIDGILFSEGDGLVEKGHGYFVVVFLSQDLWGDFPLPGFFPLRLQIVIKKVIFCCPFVKKGWYQVLVD